MHGERSSQKGAKRASHPYDARQTSSALISRKQNVCSQRGRMWGKHTELFQARIHLAMNTLQFNGRSFFVMETLTKHDAMARRSSKIQTISRFNLCLKRKQKL